MYRRIKSNQFLHTGLSFGSVQKMSIEGRKNSEKCHSKIAKQLFSIMEEKKTNLCLAADVEISEKLFNLAEELGPFICCLKTHVDAVSDWHKDSMKNIDRLKTIAKERNFLLFEDRKFADIGKTVEAQFDSEPYSISQWADLVTVHGLPGPGVLDGLNRKGSDCKVIFQIDNYGTYLNTSIYET